MASGGPRKGAGRPKGSRSKIKQNQIIARRVAAETHDNDGLIVPGFKLAEYSVDPDGQKEKYKGVSGKGGGEQPLEYMLRVMNDVEEFDERRDSMATSCAPFVHPKLQNMTVKPGGDTDLKGKGKITITMKIDGADEKDLK